MKQETVSKLLKLNVKGNASNRRCGRILWMVTLAWGVIFCYEALRETIFSDLVPKPGRFRSDIEGLTSETVLNLRTNLSEQVDDWVPNPGVVGDFQRAAQVLQHEAQRCSNVSRPGAQDPLLYGKWYVYRQPPTHEVYIYSAFYDNRPDTGILPYLRLLVVARTIKTDTFCQIWYPNVAQPVIVRIIVRKNGGGHKLNRTHYEQYYFTCSLSAAYPFPSHVSVTASPCERPQSLVPIFTPVPATPEHTFGVCVPVAFGQVDPYRLVEWVEANRLFGVTEINVYHVNMNETTLRILRYFSKEGLLRLHHLPSVPKYEPNRNGNKIGSAISLNDCMYRNMYRYQWIVVIDFDELIVPRHHSSYTPMLKHIDKVGKLARPPGGYTFRNTYFWSGCGNNTGEPRRSYIMRTFLHEKPSRKMFASKSMVDPRRCVSVFNHYCLHRFPLLDRREQWTIDVNVTIGKSHHYREIYKKDRGKKCNDLRKTGFKDDVMLRYKSQIVPRYERHLQKLGL